MSRIMFSKNFRSIKPKYHNHKIVCGDKTFASKKEWHRWLVLQQMESEGLIQDLQMQVKYVLVPAQREKETVTPRGRMKPGRVIERELSYIADFVYQLDGETIVEDVKGYKGGAAYDLFTIKRKLMLYFFGIRIHEV